MCQDLNLNTNSILSTILGFYLCYVMHGCGRDVSLICLHFSLLVFSLYPHHVSYFCQNVITSSPLCMTSVSLWRLIHFSLATRNLMRLFVGFHKVCFNFGHLRNYSTTVIAHFKLLIASRKLLL